MADQDNDAFYLVRKGDMIGIYKTLRDCQSQAGSSVLDPSITVYKGYGMSKEAEEFLRSHGLKNASYSIAIEDAKDNLYGRFGALIPCPYQQPASFGAKEDDEDSSPERWQEAVELLEMAEKTSLSTSTKKADTITGSVGVVTIAYGRERPVDGLLPTVSRNDFKSDSSMKSNEPPSNSSACDTCTIEFDGASKGNPGLAGAGVMLRSSDGSMVWKLREGVGSATNNVAEYRALLLGLRHALKVGFKHIRAQGDSKLVVMQVQGQWKTKNPNMADLCAKAKELKNKFVSFHISHVLREFNSNADALANRAIYLKDGQVEVEYQKM